MTTFEVETAWALAITSVVAPLTALPGTGVDTLPSDAVALVDCSGCRHRGEGYWTAEVRLQISSPALESDPLPAHAAAWKALALWLENFATVHTAFGPTELTLHGFWVRESDATRDDMRHIGETTLICGLQRNPV